ncbi:MAG: hypothetical protein H7X88_11855 [Gloeobacteraceae cyanobacterium ES-bin-316]|nr:hypothetical protein [Ferruginibacter sp.]
MILLLSFSSFCYAQNDKTKKDSIPFNNTTFSSAILPDSPKKYNPNVAVRRSLILPGWGQYTNKKYWKIPLVYGALGTTTFIFFRNLSQYKDAKNAYILATDTIPSNDILIKQPYYSVKDQPERIRVFRNEVRQNIDYSVLFFIAFWGLNVADAAVDAHLKTFDVNDDLSLQIKGGFSPMAHTNGVSLVLHIGR